jgi:dihydroorotate dehydrogenase electron transfer subunit
MIDTVALVLDNSETTSGYRKLVIEIDVSVEMRAGQFGMLKPHGSLEPILRRALAVYRANGSKQLTFLYQVLGRGTAALARLAAGDHVDALLPLGNAWPIADTEDRRHDKAIVVAGGIGSASVLMLCEQLAARKIDTTLLFGAATKAVARGCGLDDFSDLVPLIVTTDDGSLGERGLVTKPFERLLSDAREPAAVVYTCGPWKMMKRVAEIAASHRIRCYAALEAPMACGFGVCVGCVVAVNHSGPPGYHSYKRVCVDGSIFPTDVIRWDVEAMTH